MDYLFLLELAIILFTTKTLGLLLRKIGVPQVVGALVAGILIGPVLHLVRSGEENQVLNIMAELGVIMIMFTAGIETSVQQIKTTGLAAILVAAMGVILPLIGGFVVSAFFHGGFVGMSTDLLLQNIFVGVILTATSVSITVETLRELGKLKSNIGTIILNAAIIDDIIGIVILSVAIGVKDPETQPIMAVVNTLLFFVFAIGGGFLLHLLFKKLSKQAEHKRRLPIYALVVCLVYAFAAEQFFGVADITGAYIAGIVLSGMKTSDYIERRIDIGSYMLFAPLFFAKIGINANFNGFNKSIFLFAICFVAVGILTKFLGCFCASKMLKMKTSESAIIGIGMIARGEVALIVMQKGISKGLLNDTYLAMGVLLVMVSSLLAPLLLRLLYKHEDKKTPPDILPPTESNFLTEDQLSAEGAQSSEM